MNLRAAVFVTVPAERLVDRFRSEHHPRALRCRLPPHVTILPPFRRDRAAAELTDRLAHHFTTFSRFGAELAAVRTFPRHVWLAPEPQRTLVDLLTRTRRDFAELVHDGNDPVPHLTIAEVCEGESLAQVAALAEAELGPSLPFVFEVCEVGYYDERAEGWHELRRIQLG